MKKAILLVFLSYFAVGTSVGQSCTPNPLYADSVFGVWPDTITNFMPGQVGVWYSDTLNIIVPMDAGEINPVFAGQNIDSVRLDGVTGLPGGIGIVCNSQTSAPCTMLPSTLGCVLVEGSPAMQGSYPITVDVTGFTFFLNNVIPVPFTFSGYRIDVGAVGIDEQGLLDASSVVNVPNPFSSSTDIRFTLRNNADVQLEVFDLLGQRVWATDMRATKGTNTITFEGAEYEQGIYLYQLKAGGALYTGRMVLDR